jgi:hypothetical protein
MASFLDNLELVGASVGDGAVKLVTFGNYSPNWAASVYADQSGVDPDLAAAAEEAGAVSQGTDAGISDIESKPLSSIFGTGATTTFGLLPTWAQTALVLTGVIATIVVIYELKTFFKVAGKVL